MGISLFNSKPSILVAVSFDEYSGPLVGASVEIAKRTKKSLVLAHVCEPWLDYAASRPFHYSSPLWDVTQAVQKNARDLAMTRFGELEPLLEGVDYEFKVLSGLPADRLGAEAIASNAGLIMVGAGRANVKFIPGGFSTAYKLMNHADVPVAVIPKEMNLGESPRVLIADDLGSAGELALDFAFEFADSIPGSTLAHVHVNAMTREILQSGIDTANAAAHGNVNSGLNVDQLFTAVMEQIESRMKDRTKGQEEYLEANGSFYESSVLTGPIVDELQKRIEFDTPDFVVFGRHHTIHKKPFFLGNVPFRAMLNAEVPIIVVPDFV